MWQEFWISHRRMWPHSILSLQPADSRHHHHHQRSFKRRLNEGSRRFHNNGEGCYYTSMDCGVNISLALCLKCESTRRHFQPGEGPSTGLLRDYEPWCGPSFEALPVAPHQLQETVPLYFAHPGKWWALQFLSCVKSDTLFCFAWIEVRLESQDDFYVA